MRITAIMQLFQIAKASVFIFALMKGTVDAQGPDAKTKSDGEYKADSPAAAKRIEKEVRHHLIMLPFYNLFDNLVYRVDGTTVTLLGQVVRPTLKSDAESTVKEIEGVERVINQIEVLPLSPSDDRLRVALYHTVYSQAPLQRYAMGAVPPIHIIVKNGNATLEGVVSNESDKNMAGIAANQVPGVFSVTNNLRTETAGK